MTRHTGLWMVLALALACDDGTTPAQEALDGAVDALDPDGAVDGPTPDQASADAAPDVALDAALDAAPDATPDAQAPDAVEPDATQPDVADPDAASDPPDATPDAAPECPEPEDFDYSCELDDPATCPDGLCVFGLCIGPVVDADRWADCGDDACGPCEDDALCPADCAAPPVFAGEKRYDGAGTLTVFVGGFNVVGADEFEDQIYGEARSFGTGELALRFAPDIPDGREHPDAPNQMIGVRYYGARPAEWLSPEQVAAIEALDWRTPDALPRYAHIVAWFLEHRMAATGATHVNLMCHSMGCHLSRYIIEHDLAGLASNNRIVRWTTLAGVVGGARLARLFDNPQIREIAEGLNLNTSDFVHMHPDHVADHSARWDHRLRVAGNPLFQGVLMHHQVATDPRVSQTANLVRLLDLNNPDDEPNDGIMYSLDQYFHDQPEALRAQSMAGVALPPSRSYQHFDHELIKDSLGSGVMAAAALYHRRKVEISLRIDRLLVDLEQDHGFDFENEGLPPAEIAVQTTVRYDPYITDTFGETVVVHQQRVDDRSPEVTVVAEGEGAAPIPLFYAPVFDQMDALHMDIDVLEVDDYNRFGVHESLFDRDDRLIQRVGVIPLQDAEIPLVNEQIEATLIVRVHALYE